MSPTDRRNDAARHYSRDELIAELGMTPEQAARIWNAFGFAHHDQQSDTTRYTEMEVSALRLFAGSELTLPDKAQVATARAIGQAMSRLAEWQADHLIELERDPRIPYSREQMIDAMEVAQRLIWQRHLELALDRDVARESENRTDLVVGFVDIVGYTSMSRRIDMTELEDLLETFETRTFDIVSDRDGRVIKTLGDAVMFSFEDALDAADAALHIQQLSGADPIPPLRVGLARGPVLPRLGDLYGEPVNIASRLCGSARPGTILVDEAVAADLDDAEQFHLKPISPLSVRGYRRLKSYVLEADKNYGRSGPGSADGSAAP